MECGMWCPLASSDHGDCDALELGLVIFDFMDTVGSVRAYVRALFLWPRARGYDDGQSSGS